jgi:hypothetical protein
MANPSQDEDLLVPRRVICHLGMVPVSNVQMATLIVDSLAADLSPASSGRGNDRLGVLLHVV